MELLDIEEVGAAPTTALAPADRAALALESSKTEQHLMTLATKHASITVVKDKAGREQAHGAYIEVMRARTAVEKAAKEAREDANKFSRAVIAEAARLVAIVEPEEARLKAARDAWDEEQARIKAEAEAKERARVRAAAEEMAAQRAELERMRAELEAKSKPAEQPVCAEEHQAPELLYPEPAFAELAAPAVATTGVPLIQGEVGTVDAAIAIVEGPRAPVASAIVLAVASYWDTDTKTAARWIAERAGEIATLKG